MDGWDDVKDYLRGGARDLVSGAMGAPGTPWGEATRTALAGARAVLPGGGTYREQRDAIDVDEGLSQIPEVRTQQIREANRADMIGMGAGMAAPVRLVSRPAGWAARVIGGTAEREWQNGHRPPDVHSGAPLYDLTAGIYPDDVYGPAGARIYGHGEPALDRKTLAVAREVRGEPDAQVPVYRAVPLDVPHADIHAGDWVTPNLDYAITHGEGPLRGDYQIIERRAKAKDLFTDGNSIHEFGYDPNRFDATAEHLRTPWARALADDLAQKHPGVSFDLMPGAGNTVVLSRIEVPSSVRGEGRGSAFMEDLVRAADENGLTLAATPSADFGGTPTRIRGWNKRFGFVDNKGRSRDFEISESMYRKPQQALRRYPSLEEFLRSQEKGPKGAE